MPNIQEKFRLTPPVPVRVIGVGPYPFVIPSEHLIGIEVEVENVAANDIPRNSVWSAIADNSLRNNGVEYVSAPIRASEAPMALSQLMREVLQQQCHFSPRTSVHVHLNVQDLEVQQVQSMVMLYAVFERLFYRFAGRGRIRNIYCVPITETSVMGGMLEQQLGAGWSKYTGLNLLPIRGVRGGGDDAAGAYGTIEYRQMHGTFSVDKLCCWIDLITTLKEFVMKTSMKEIRAIIVSMDDDFDYYGLLTRIFGEKAAWLKYEGFEDVKSTHLVAKSALFSGKTYLILRGERNTNTPFYKFKG